jgi:chromosome segregation ATPase
VTCFNVSVSFAQTYKFPKSRGGGEFTIKYLEAAFNQEACSGEFFIEFDESVWEHKLVESFELGGSGACQVMCVTFNSNDKNESASNALFRVLESQKKTGLSYRRGTIPPALLAKVQAKQEATKNLSADNKEVDEKTARAMQESLKLNYAKLETIDTNVQSQGVKLDGIQQGVCQVIPDKQKEIDSLKEALAHKTKLCDSIEGKMAYKTRIINQLDARIAQLEQANLDHITERQAWIAEKADLLQQLETKRSMQSFLDGLKQEQIETKKSTQSLMDNLKHVAGLLSTTLAEERACKRARESDE